MTAPQKQWSKEQWSIVRYNGRLIVRQGDAVVFDESESPLTESQWQFICERVNFCAGYSREAFELMSRALENDKDLSPLQELERINHEACQEAELARVALNESDKERARLGLIDMALTEYVHELTGNEGEDDALTVLKAHIASLTQQAEANEEAREFVQEHGHTILDYFHEDNPVYIALKRILSQPSPVEAQEEEMADELDTRFEQIQRLNGIIRIEQQRANTAESQLTDLREKVKNAEHDRDLARQALFSCERDYKEKLRVAEDKFLHEEDKRLACERALKPTSNPIAERALEWVKYNGELLLLNQIQFPPTHPQTIKLRALLSEIEPSKGREEK